MTLAQTIIRKWIQPGMDKMIAEGSADAIAAAAATAAADATAAATVAATAATTSAKNQEWRAWLTRRDAALALGQPFHEPAPDETTPT